MKEIQLKEAKAKFSHVVDEAVAGEAAIITRHGKKEAVIISYSEYERLSRVPSFGWFLANSPLGGRRSANTAAVKVFAQTCCLTCTFWTLILSA